MENFIDYYEILQVSPDTSRENIKKSYRRLTKVYHPDIGNKDDQIMKRINEAYENLSDSEKKNDYDEIYRKYYHEPVREKYEFQAAECPSEAQVTSFTIAKEVTLKDYSEKIILTAMVCLVILILVLILVWAVNGLKIVIQKNHFQSVPDISLSNAGLINFSVENQSTKGFNQLDIALHYFNREIIMDSKNLLFFIDGSIYKDNGVKGIKKLDREKTWATKASFSLGSSEDEVREVMGVPQSRSYNTWSYGLSTIVFNPNGMVIGWNEVDQDIKASIGEKDPLAKPFSLGSNKKAVIAAMGTPTGIISDTTWYYSLSSVRFDSEGRVAGWNESDLAIKVSFGNKKEWAKPFGKGSTKQDVIYAMGTPTGVIYDLWYYGSSSVKFNLGGRVEDWNEVDVVLKAEY